jgi:hypothetical protein
MKILITESQFRNILDEYFNRIIKSPEYDFIDRIEVIEGTTKIAGWKNDYEKPFYEYIVHANDDDERIADMYDKIGDIHKIMFPRNDDGTPRAYYTINTEYEF